MLTILGLALLVSTGLVLAASGRRGRGPNRFVCDQTDTDPSAPAAAGGARQDRGPGRMAGTAAPFEPGNGTGWPPFRTSEPARA